MCLCRNLDPNILHNFGGLELGDRHLEQAGKKNAEIKRGHLSLYDEVPVETIDSLDLTRLDLIKIDAQGMEEKVCNL